LDGARRIAFVGLAKNTGKTTALTTLIPELGARGERLGVTSVGRDGEIADVLDHTIRKPAVPLPAGSLVATTDALLDRGVAHQVVARTGHRTPLGRVVVAELGEPAALEVAGPGTGKGIREISELMLAHGCDRVLIDGSIDRRATAAPFVADGVVVATGAVLGSDPETAVRWTRTAVDVAQAPVLADPRIRDLARAHAANLLVTGSYETVAVAPQLPLTGSGSMVASLFQDYPTARYLLVRGAPCEPFVEHVLRARLPGPVTLVVADATRIFLSRRGVRWYARHGVRIETLGSTTLCAITVNPVAPGSHHMPALQARIAAEIGEIPVLDVLGAS